MSNPQLEIITIEQHDAPDASPECRTEGKHHYPTTTRKEEAEIQVASKNTKNGACSPANDHPSSSQLTVGHLKSSTQSCTAADVSNRTNSSEQPPRNSSSSTIGSTLIDIESGVAVVEHHHLQTSTSSELPPHPQKKTSFEMNPSSTTLVSNGHSSEGNSSPAVPASTIQNSSAISTSQTNLVRKHSCGDLVSRLKSRKLLGVGESSENRGEVYRSKISQLLGHSEHLFAKFPLAFWHWYALLIFIHIITGLWNLFGHLLRSQAEEASDKNSNVNSMSDNIAVPLGKVDDNGLLAISKFFRQFVGILYLAFATLLWRFYRINDKGLVRYVLLVCSTFSLAKIILMFYYDHCNVIELKDWLISFVCSSACSPELPSTTLPSSRSCSLFSPSIQENIISSTEMTVYLFVESLLVFVNLFYRYKMANSGATSSSGSSSLLTTGAIGVSRRVSTPAGGGPGGPSSTAAFPCCEYVALLLGTYVLQPVSRLFRRPSSEQTGAESSEGVSRTNISAPASPSTLGKPPPDGHQKESVDKKKDGVTSVKDDEKNDKLAHNG